MLKTLLGVNSNDPITRATAYLNKIDSSFAELELALNTMETQYMAWGVECPKFSAWILEPKDPTLYPESYEFNCFYKLLSSWVEDPVSILSAPLHTVKAALQYAICVKYRKKNILKELKPTGCPSCPIGCSQDATTPQHDASI